jgi:hypothetical protein
MARTCAVVTVVIAAAAAAIAIVVAIVVVIAVIVVLSSHLGILLVQLDAIGCDGAFRRRRLCGVFVHCVRLEQHRRGPRCCKPQAAASHATHRAACSSEWHAACNMDP